MTEKQLNAEENDSEEDDRAGDENLDDEDDEAALNSEMSSNSELTADEDAVLNGDDEESETQANKSKAKISPSDEANEQASSKKKKPRQDEDVIELLDSSSESAKVDGSSFNSDVESQEDWEGSEDEGHDEVVYAVIKACPHGAKNAGYSLHSSEHVRVLAAYRSKAKAHERADRIRANLFEGGHHDGYLPNTRGLTEFDEVNIWVQAIRVYNSN